MRTLNLGILAHVDAGKTSLTERLLHAAGVIDEIGSVDDGTTQTDTLALERARGITIKSAVVSFVVDDLTINLIDTPGHPDFIAEVERVLCVLDGAVLVISAVEGVQAQTRVLMRTLARLRIPTLFFVNKIDRGGAQPERVLAGIAEKLSPAIVAMGTADGPGTPHADFTACGPRDAAFARRLLERLAEHDDALLEAYVADASAVSREALRDGLGRQTRQARVHPVYFGSAITGAGVEALVAGICELLAGPEVAPAGDVAGTVFKIARGESGEKVAYVRMFSGALRVRDRLPLARQDERKITAIRVFERGAAVPCASLEAGRIGQVFGLGDVRIGDAIGAARADATAHYFAPPTLETVILPRRAADRGTLRTALVELAEQDPLINLRQDDVQKELFVSLYGEVQKQVIAETLAADYGVEVEFRETTTICIERPIGSGAAVESRRRMRTPEDPFLATVGLRIDAAAIGSGVAYRLEVEPGSLPLAFRTAIEETVHETLRQGLHGWEVRDCRVTLTHSGYSPRQSHAHATFDKAMSSTGWDFRSMTPLVLMRALVEARTTVCEPIHRFRLELPREALGAILPVLAGLGAVPERPLPHASQCTLEGEIPAVRVHELRQRLAAITRGEGVLECAFERYRPVRGALPSRPRTDRNPLDRKEYLLRLSRRI